MRLVTLNLWGDRAPLEARLRAAARGLAALAPDVICLQEVRLGDGLANTAETLAGLLGGAWRASYGTATCGAAGVWGPGTGAGEEGLAILARHPLSAPQVTELPEARDDERRILLSARVDVGGVAVWCHTTHLHWRLHDGLAREAQAARVDEAARAAGGSGDAVHLLAGDFNAAPDCDEIRFLRGRHTLAGRRAYWQDAWAARRPDERGWTWARRNPNTEWLKWLELDRRIDYVFVSPERRDGRGRIVDARVVLDAPDADGVWASDHLAVLADVEIRPTP
jgi:endonuclease/exonuclease/phosphatase family metal-dependent hydrolase